MITQKEDHPAADRPRRRELRPTSHVSCLICQSQNVRGRVLLLTRALENVRVPSACKQGQHAQQHDADAAADHAASGCVLVDSIVLFSTISVIIPLWAYEMRYSTAAAIGQDQNWLRQVCDLTLLSTLT